MLPDPRFSVILPVHNGEPYIGAAIESVLAQTYPHFDLLVLENGSQDRTVSIVQSYQDTRIRLLEAGKSLSIQENWQRILSLEMAEYITILGHDDLLYPGFLEEIAQLIQQVPDAALYQTHFDIIGSSGELLRPCKPIPYRESADHFLADTQCFQRDSFGTGYIMRAADYQRMGGLPDFPALYYADDIAWLRLIGVGEKICSPKILFAYRFHVSSTGHRVGLKDLYLASKAYFAALANAGYMQTETQRNTAYHYAAVMFSRQQYKLLTQLIAAPDPEKFKHFRMEKAEVLRMAQSDQLFPINDKVARILELILKLPAPLRHIPLQIIEAAKVATRFVRHR